MRRCGTEGELGETLGGLRGGRKACKGNILEWKVVVEEGVTLENDN